MAKRFRRPFLYMRKKSIFGTFFGRHAGVSNLSKSVGHAVENNIIVAAGVFDFGIGTDAVDTYGFNRLAPYGSMSPLLFNGHIINDLVTNDTTKQILLLFGVSGTTQIENTTVIKLFLSGFSGDVEAVWSVTQLRYEVTDTAFSDYIVANNGNDLKLTIQPL